VWLELCAAQIAVDWIGDKVNIVGNKPTRMEIKVV